MICFIEQSEIGALRLELLRDQCFITLFPFGAECIGIERFMFNTNTGILYMLLDELENVYIDINDLTFILSGADNMFRGMEFLRHIVSEALKWTEFWHGMD